MFLLAPTGLLYRKTNDDSICSESPERLMSQERGSLLYQAI